METNIIETIWKTKGTNYLLRIILEDDGAYLFEWFNPHGVYESNGWITKEDFIHMVKNKLYQKCEAFKYVEESKRLLPIKTFYIMYNVGKVKYLVNYNDGEKTHSDGSKFFDVRCFSNKQKMQKFVNELKRNDYVETSVFA